MRDVRRIAAVALREDEIRASVEHVAEACAGFGAPVSFETRTVWVNVTASAGLFGGEVALAQAMGASVGALGVAHRVAIASGPRVAAAIAHYGSGEGPFVVAQGEDGAAMRALPLAALGMELGDALGWLSRLGIERVGDLQRAPRRGLGSRLGRRAASVLALADGDDRAPLVPWSPPEVPAERVDFEYGVERAEALLFVAKTLTARLALRLQGRGVLTCRLMLVLHLDRALVHEGEARTTEVGCALPAPMRRAEDLLAVLAARLERFTLTAPVLSVVLEAHELSAQKGRALQLFVPESKAERALERLVAELGALLGEARVGTLAMLDSLDPDARTRLVPIAQARPKQGLSELVSASVEPVRWLRAAQPCVAGPASLLVRVACIEWWRRAAGRDDYVAQWSAEHADLACVRIAENGTRAIVGWMD